MDDQMWDKHVVYSLLLFLSSGGRKKIKPSQLEGRFGGESLEV